MTCSCKNSMHFLQILYKNMSLQTNSCNYYLYKIFCYVLTYVSCSNLILKNKETSYMFISFQNCSHCDSAIDQVGFNLSLEFSLCMDTVPLTVR